MRGRVERRGLEAVRANGVGDDLAFFGEHAADRVDEAAAGSHEIGHARRDRDLQRRQARDVFGRATSLEIRTAADCSDAGAGRVQEHAVERPVDLPRADAPVDGVRGARPQPDARELLAEPLELARVEIGRLGGHMGHLESRPQGQPRDGDEREAAR